MTPNAGKTILKSHEKARNLNTATSIPDFSRDFQKLVPKNRRKKASPLQKDCLQGKELNPKTGRCITLKNSRKKKASPLQKDCLQGKCIPPKNSRKKKASPVQKDCPEGKERNPKTGRCIKIK